MRHAPSGGMAFCRGIILVLLAAAGVLSAHEIGLSTAQVRLGAESIELSLAFAPSDARMLLSSDARWEAEGFAAVRSRFEELAPLLVELRAGGAVLGPQDIRAEYNAADDIVFRLVYPRPAAGPLGFRALNLEVLPPGHRLLLTVAGEGNAPLAEKMLDAKNPAAEVGLPAAGRVPAGEPAEAAPRGAQVAGDFLKLGLEHIWTGYDHLLFLLGLLLVCRTFKSIVAIITCFTLAHSLTLALATFNLVNLPGRLVEPAIAASIVFVGVENLLRGGEEPRGRWALTFLFGLVHGFGFATVLRDLGVGSGGSGAAMPLFMFNLGVEAGQVAVAAVVLPLVWHLRKNAAFLRRGVPALSALVAAAGLYWLVERTLLA